MNKNYKYAQQQKSPLRNLRVDNNNYEPLIKSPSGDSGVFIERANSADFAEILEIQKKAFLSEAELYQNFSIQPLTQTLNDMKKECISKIVLKALDNDKMVGSVRAYKTENVCHINKLVVLYEYRRRGIGEKLLLEIENYFTEVEKFTLETGAYSESNIRLYRKAGYQIAGKSTFESGVEAVIMEKTNQSPPNPLKGGLSNYQI